MNWLEIAAGIVLIAGLATACYAIYVKTTQW